MKYYKIVNPKGHYGLVYKEGYNEDTLPFDPSGKCKPGGIYFAQKDILAFVDYGTELYEVEPVGEIYEEHNGITKKFKAHAVNLKYVGKIQDTKILKMLIDTGADIQAGDNNITWWAISNEHVEILKLLIDEGINISYINVRSALFTDNLETIKLLKEAINK